MIKYIWIDNFKSLVDFELTPAKFTCLVGLNGAGKSTVLQAMDFISQLMIGDIDEWLKQRQWDSADINSKLTSKSNIDFKIVVDHRTFGEITWSGSINRKTLSCTRERVERKEINYLKVDDGHCSIKKSTVTLDSADKGVDLLNFDSSIERFPIMFEYQGSILSQLKENQTNPVVNTLKELMLNIRSLDLLSPELLRSRTKSADGKLGLGGQKLSAFIHESGKSVKMKLKNDLSQVYKQLERVDTRSLRSGWKQLEIIERFGDQLLKTTGRHLNDGMLRLIAVLAQLESENDFLLFDEIENGINPELIEYLIDHLINSSHQILVTTHSPVILNYLEDDVAVKGIVYLYKNTQGSTSLILRRLIQTCHQTEICIHATLRWCY